MHSQAFPLLFKSLEVAGSLVTTRGKMMNSKLPPLMAKTSQAKSCPLGVGGA
jgi:hypothetical protein